jgi:hypothetical protein
MGGCYRQKRAEKQFRRWVQMTSSEHFEMMMVKMYRNQST